MSKPVQRNISDAPFDLGVVLLSSYDCAGDVVAGDELVVESVGKFDGLPCLRVHIKGAPEHERKPTSSPPE